MYFLGGLARFGGIQKLLGGRTVLHGNLLAGEGSEICKSLILHRENHAVLEIRVAQVHCLCAGAVHTHAVPDAVNLAGVQFLFLRVPGNRLRLELHAQASTNFGSEVDIKAHDVVVLVAETHRRERIVKAEHEHASRLDLVEGFISSNLRFGLLFVTGRENCGTSNSRKHRKNLFHLRFLF